MTGHVRVGEIEQDLSTWRHRINRVLDLHQRTGGDEKPWCTEDGRPWPCRTVRALTGDEP